MHRGLLLSIAIVLLANAATLALVALDRQGEEATITLTERELRLSPAGLENTGIALSLEWRYPRTIRHAGSWSWFDRTRLEDVGFDCSVALDAPEAKQHYRRQAFAPRAALVVLEYRPDAVPDAVEALQPFEGAGEPRQLTEEERRRLPRLAAVDVGLDAGQLRSRYPDRSRFVIVHGTVQLIYRPEEPSRSSTAPAGSAPAQASADARTSPPGPAASLPALSGSVTMVYPSQIYVPKEHRAILEELRPKEGSRDLYWAILSHRPRYEVTLTWGSRLEPRVTGVRRLASGSGEE
ncbi:MAG: DUF4824 family protein [Vicinamibacterales bacterium]